MTFVPGKTRTGKTCKNCVKAGKLCAAHEAQATRTLGARKLKADAPGRKNGHMVLFRLDPSIKAALYEAIEAEGHTSKNAWFKDQVLAYLKDNGVEVVETDEDEDEEA